MPPTLTPVFASAHQGCYPNILSSVPTAQSPGGGIQATAGRSVEGRGPALSHSGAMSWLTVSPSPSGTAPLSPWGALPALPSLAPHLPSVCPGITFQTGCSQLIPRVKLGFQWDRI